MPLFWSRRNAETAPEVVPEPLFEIYQRFHRVHTEIGESAKSSEWPSIDRYLSFRDVEFPVDSALESLGSTSENPETLDSAPIESSGLTSKGISKTFRKASTMRRKSASDLFQSVSPKWTLARPILKNKANANFRSEKENLLRADTVPFRAFWKAFEKTEKARANNAPLLSSARWGQVRNYYRSGLAA